jgi:hypothetical protein
MAIRKLYGKDIKVNSKLLGLIGDYAGPSDMYVKKVVIDDMPTKEESDALHKGFTDGMATILGLSIEKITEIKKQLK